MKETWGGTFDSDGTETPRISVERLLNEIGGEAEGVPERLLEDALASLPDGECDFEEAIVKHSLDELLLVLIALHDGGTHGKQLMDDLADLFDAQLSPGTVYPRLHEMEAEGTVTVHEMVRTKEYTIADEESARRRVRRGMKQHLAVGLFLQRALNASEL